MQGKEKGKTEVGKKGTLQKSFVLLVKNGCANLCFLSSKRFCCVKIHKEKAVFSYKHDRFPQFFVDFRHMMCYH